MVRLQFFLGVALCVAVTGCSGNSSPTAPTAAREESSSIQTLVARASSDASAAAMERAVAAVFAERGSSSAAITFPPRNEPLEFRNALEAKYRDGLRRAAVETYVDAEGTIVWTLEYLRYRANLCSHSDAVSRVMSQIDGLGVPAVCGNVATATFPPRNEPLAFMQQLEAKYRDSLRRSPGSSFVDVEGNIVWTQEYLRYRVSTCSHTTAQQKVFDQIDGRGVQADCTPAVVIAPTPTPRPTPIPTPTPTPTPTPSPNRTRIGAVCRDGTLSGATGSGACSSHGGVSCWRYSDQTCTNP
jgi:hypothetical protein